MGRLHRRFIRTWRATAKNKITLDRNIPIDIIEGVVGITGSITVAAAVDLTGTLYGLHSDIAIAAGATVSDHVMGIDSSITVTGEATRYIIGLRLSMTAPDTGRVEGDIWAICINNFIDVAVGPTGSYDMIRIAENSGAIVDRLFHIGVNYCEYFMRLTNNTNAWNCAGDKSGTAGTVNGWLRLTTPAGDRYIQLYS